MITKKTEKPLIREVMNDIMLDYYSRYPERFCELLNIKLTSYQKVLLRMFANSNVEYSKKIIKGWQYWFEYKFKNNISR